MPLTDYLPRSAVVEGEPQEPFTGHRSPEAKDDAPVQATLPMGVTLGWWLEEPDEEKVAKDIVKRWKQQDKAMKSRFNRWDFNARRRDGDQYSKLQYNPDTGETTIYVPMGAENAPPSLNKTDALCSKMVANMLVDPPRPDAEPPSDSDEDRSSAEFTTRALTDLHSESGLAMDETLREAEELACSYGSGFIRYYTDPTGGGQRPREIMAGFDPITGQQAKTEAEALQRAVPIQPAAPAGVVGAGEPVAGGPVGAGAPVPGVPAPPPQLQPWPDYRLRYVAPDGTLTDSQAEAEIVWLPKVKREILTGKHVRFLPDTASGIHDADGVILAGFVQLGTLKRMFADKMGSMKEDDIRAMVKHRPEMAKHLLPKHVQLRDQSEEKRSDGKDGPPDDALVLVYTMEYLDCPEYPRGADVIVGGDKYLLDRRPHMRETERDGKLTLDRHDLRLVQVRQFLDTRDRDPYGRGLVDKVGDGDPLMAIALGYLIEYVYRANNPHIFVPMMSGIDDKSLTLPRSTPIPYNPANGGKPVFEEIPPFAQATMELYHLISSEMNDRSGLHDVAQGESNPEVQSGRHARIIVEQALVALSGAQSAMRDAFVRGCRIQTQLMRSDYTTPQKIRIVGEDGAYKVKDWTGADLGSTTDVKVQAGTGTMLSPSAKAAVASEQLEIAVKRQDARGIDRYYRALSGNTHPLLGLEDDPAAMEVKRSIAKWEEGAPAGFDVVFGQYQLQSQQRQMQVQQYQQAMQPVPPELMQPIPVPMTPFVPRPNHEDPFVAKVRYDELNRAMSGTKYAKQPPQWRALFDMEYQRMRHAAGVATVREQQAAAAQQQQADRDAKAKQAGEQRASASAEKNKDRAHEAAEGDKDRQAQAERESMRSEMQALRRTPAAA